MTKRSKKQIIFQSIKNLKIHADFSGGSITSNAGLSLLRGVDLKLKLTEKISSFFTDNRQQGKITHSILSMIQQLVFGIAAGYEDLNDHDQLCKDVALQVASGRTSKLASPSTLCRLENEANRKMAIEINKLLVEQFILFFKVPPKSIVLDFDPTDTTIYGNQEGKHYNGYYKDYCFLPLYVFCGEKLLISYLRGSNEDPALHVGAILNLLVKRLRQVWPDVRILFRGDCGMNRHQISDWCERKKVKYLTGLSGNSQLQKMISNQVEKAKAEYKTTGENQKIFTEFMYAAKTWSKKRRVIAKIEYNEKGLNTRFIVTNLQGDPEGLYSKVYCARGNMENKIKETQLELFGTRTSCTKWWSNQFRMLLTAAAYVLMEALRSEYLVGTKFAKMQVGTIRSKLIKIGAVIIKNTRRIYFRMASSYPYQSEFAMIAKRLNPG